MLIKPHFCVSTAGNTAYDKYNWVNREATIKDSKGNILYHKANLIFPSNWSDSAVTTVASKYFFGDKEYSLKQLVDRVVDTITQWGKQDDYFFDIEEEYNFLNELKTIIIDQKAAFNSPVWFNLGVTSGKDLQAAACFILSVEDNMQSILESNTIQGLVFKQGSGIGINLSKLRSSYELVTGGGTASGAVSFLKGYDSWGGVIKSGAKHRRSASMWELDVVHPDIISFIECKVKEEKKARALIAANYSGDFSDPDGAYATVAFQNGNLAVRVTDDFMNAVIKDGDWSTRFVTTGEVHKTYKARDIFRKMATSIHACGDPGIQFDDTMNVWNTCANVGRINGTNPCSELSFLDDSSCNLASLNILRFLNDDGTFDIESFKHAIKLMVIAQDILIDNASYPTEKITENSKKLRPIGLSFINLGAFLMSVGLPYDSGEGRLYAACLTSLMTSYAFCVSNELARVKGAYHAYDKDVFSRVMLKHLKVCKDLDIDLIGRLGILDIYNESLQNWERVTSMDFINVGFRNSQVTLFPPGGTISFMMDCDTTGIEPDIALVKFKKLADGGMMKIVNGSIPRALRNLKYPEESIKTICDYVDANGTIEGSILNPDHLPIFDCAFKPAKGTRFISYKGHLKMMGAVQPFISGSISKTINLPSVATVEDIENIYIEAWKLGLKSVTIYRDGTKYSQPLNTSDDSKEEAKSDVVKQNNKPYRMRLPATRISLTHKFSIEQNEGYFTFGLDEKGEPKELFIEMNP